MAIASIMVFFRLFLDILINRSSSLVENLMCCRKKIRLKLVEKDKLDNILWENWQLFLLEILEVVCTFYYFVIARAFDVSVWLCIKAGEQHFIGRLSNYKLAFSDKNFCRFCFNMMSCFSKNPQKFKYKNNLFFSQIHLKMNESSPIFILSILLIMVCKSHQQNKNLKPDSRIWCIKSTFSWACIRACPFLFFSSHKD